MRLLFDEEQEKLHIRFSEMGMMVSEAIHKSVRAFINHDKELAHEVIVGDYKINEREMKLEKQTLEMIALYQPVTSDLRDIVTVLKAISDLERMGDHAVSIARSTIRVKGNPRVIEIEEEIGIMGDHVRKMVEEVLTAYIRKDAEKARKVANLDLEVDEYFTKIYDQCIHEMKTNPETVVGSADYLMVATYLERIGDYVTNVCEWVVYLKNGRITELNPGKSELEKENE